MRMPTVLALTCLMVVAGLCGADVAKAKNDPLQGNWKLVSAEYGGMPVPQEIIKRMDSKLRIEGNKWTDDTAGQDGKRDVGLNTFKIDATKSPKQVDITDAEPEKGKEPDVVLGIYEIDGDTLELCIRRPGAKERPTEFKSQDRTTMVRVYTRVK